MEKNASTWSYVTAYVSTAVGGITLDQVALWIGIITAVGTFAVNWYYKARADKRDASRVRP